jgi:hypothetical protein
MQDMAIKQQKDAKKCGDVSASQDSNIAKAIA